LMSILDTFSVPLIISNTPLFGLMAISIIGGGKSNRENELLGGDGPNWIFRVRRVGREVTKGLAVVEPRLFGFGGGVWIVNRGVPVGLFEDLISLLSELLEWSLPVYLFTLRSEFLDARLRHVFIFPYQTFVIRPRTVQFPLATGVQTRQSLCKVHYIMPG